MKFLIDYMKGILIGSGAILPGISSGVFCVIFGIYEKLINSVLNLFHDFKKSFTFLLPIGLGGITGVLLVGKLLNFFFNEYPMPTKFCFIGLILGSIPVLFRQANQKNGFRLHSLHIRCRICRCSFALLHLRISCRYTTSDIFRLFPVRSDG